MFYKTGISTLLLLSLVLMQLAACSNPEQAAPAEPAETEGVEVAAVEPAAPPTEEAETGARLKFIDPKGTGDSNVDKLAGIQQTLNSGSSQVDIFTIDLIWSGILAEHALDLAAYIPATELEAHSVAILKNYRADGKLVALPRTADAGLLYYRADLLKKYGFAEPPVTWDELEAMAATIQAGERAAGDAEFWGFVWQGANYEGLACDALEWQVSHNGGRIIEPDGTITVNNPGALAAYERAAGWVGVISPPDVVEFDEALSLNLFENGHAAFMRQWPWFFDDDIHTSIVEGRYGVTVLPTAGAQHAATMGGWGLMASKYSTHPELAAKFVALMTGPEVQKQWALLDGDLPSIEALYHDPELLAVRPYLPDLLPVVQSAVARPSTVTGAQYAEVSAAYYNHVHSILTGQVSAAGGVVNLEAELIDITGFEAQKP